MRARSEYVLIDSSAWIEALRPDGDVRYREMVDRLLSENVAATCEIVIAEVLQGARDEREKRELAEDLSALHRLDMNGVGERAGEIALKLRKQGQRIPTTDLVIAATAAVHEAAILHRDGHLVLAAQASGIESVEV